MRNRRRRTIRAYPYGGSRRRRRIRRSNVGPWLALFGTIIGIAGIALLMIYVVLPKVLPLIGVESVFAPTPSPTATPAPTPTPHPMTSFVPENAQSEIIFDGSTDYKWFADPYVYGDEVIFSAGKLQDGNAVMLALFLYEPAERTATQLNFTLANSHFLTPRFNDDWIVWLDANMNGGGAIMCARRNDTSTVYKIKDVYTGQPELYLDGSHICWIERTGTRMDKLFVADLETQETTTLRMFSNSVYGQSKPFMNDGMILWAESGVSGAADGGLNSSIAYIKFGSSNVTTFEVPTYVHDPEYTSGYYVWLDAHHATDTGLWIMKDGTAPEKIADGVVEFGVGSDFVVYSTNQTIYAYYFDSGESYRVTSEREHVMFLGTSDDHVMWMDVTSRERDIMKLCKLP